MTNVNRWLLPDGIDEVLPARALAVEHLRRQLLDLYHNWGYDLVIPPMVEFTESLLSGSGSDLDLMTFRLTDQLSGRLMGLRADITPQAARMDAHSLRRSGPSRLCYSGTVVHTRPRGPLESRMPISIGVELFGEGSLSADIEVIELFLQTLKASGVEQVHLDLGHVDILRGLVADANLSDVQTAELYGFLQSKAVSELNDWVQTNIGVAEVANRLKALPGLSGGIDVLQRARDQLAGASQKVLAAIQQLEQVVTEISEHCASSTIYLDLGESPGYHYHTGLVFAAYVPGFGKALGNGGRYDHVGEAFGRSRPATGFAFDLKALIDQGSGGSYHSIPGIYVPYSDNPQRWKQIALLRSQGNRVVAGFDGQDTNFAELNCDRQLVEQDGQFVIRALS